MSQHKQIFQANSPLRWKSFKWTTRIFFFVLFFVMVIVVVAIIRGKAPSLPNIESKDKLFENAMNLKDGFNLSSPQNKKYKGFKAFLNAKQKEDSLNKLTGKNTVTGNPFIRAAFYSPSSNYAVSHSDLEENANKLNTIFPEWFFIDLKDHDKIDSRIDSAGLAIMKKYNLRIIPMFTNFNSVKQDFDGSLIHTMLNDPAKRIKFINNLVDTLTKYQLQGINIDFEELQEKTVEPLNNFQKDLYQIFHSKNLLVTQDVIPDNDDYDFEKLNAYNDYIVLMAYDQHNDAVGGPGPVSGQKWIEEVLDKAAAKMENNKIILGLSGFGYDWSMDENGKPLREEGKLVKPEDVTYSQALDRARLSGANVEFDNDNFNLHYNYSENKGGEQIQHVVWFTGAVTTYNILRFSDEYSTAGTALWVLGKEDRRMWKFYNRDLSNNALKQNPYNYNDLLALPYDINQKPTPIGEGELLRILYTPRPGSASLEIDSSEQLITEQKYLQLPSGYVYEKFAEDTTEIGPGKKGHKLILTFDDGPSPEWTPKILDILEKEKVPATFFIVGINAEKDIPLLQRIYKDGYEIGNHTFTHNNIAKMSPRRADLEMKTTRLLIESVTGHSTILFRAPYNADSEPQTFEEIEPIARSKNDNYITVGEAIDPNDWDDEHVNADSIFNRVVRQTLAGNSNIILLHDAGGNTRQATVEALPRIITYFRDSLHCRFTTVADLMGKTKDDVMPPVKRDWKLRFNFYFTIALYWGMHILFAMFIIGIILSIARITFIAILAWLQNKKEKNIPVTNAQPGVSVIVPAYNEEINAVRTVESLLQQDYPNMQIVFVDDGSKDSTFKTVSEYFANMPNVQVVTKENGGKATALNYGINIAVNDYVVCIDADTQLKKDAISQLMKKFYSAPGKPEVGAVAGNVKVGNEINLVTRWQSIEYTTSQNFDRSAFDYLNCITVVPGAIGAFKKEAVIKAGGFTTDTLAEDCDLTMRMHRNGYRIANCRQAISYTEAPESFKQFLKQRFRWSFGVMQSFWKHRDAFLNPKYKNFGMVAMPHILIFQMILPVLAPLADLVLILSLVAAGFGIIPASLGHIVLYYFLFSLVDMIGAVIAFNFENAALKKYNMANGQRNREDYKKLLWLLPQQLIYRQLMYYILIKSFNKALKGELQGWGALKRTGNVKKMEVSG
jgi:cellulose synthase/poly-beta-1,6-N-acetylglucosamine synthase-like glycosyltransferase/spore germination protein YaaH/peptidoglycan/xylan/chitin deacetylase (PgdA/CDA1 family)